MLSRATVPKCSDRFAPSGTWRCWRRSVAPGDEVLSESRKARRALKLLQKPSHLVQGELWCLSPEKGVCSNNSSVHVRPLKIRHVSEACTGLFGAVRGRLKVAVAWHAASICQPSHLQAPDTAAFGASLGASKVTHVKSATSRFGCTLWCQPPRRLVS